MVAGAAGAGVKGVAAGFAVATGFLTVDVAVDCFAVVVVDSLGLTVGDFSVARDAVAATVGFVTDAATGLVTEDVVDAVVDSGFGAGAGEVFGEDVIEDVAGLTAAGLDAAAGVDVTRA